ncbi:MAG: hypothetical protein ACK4IB_01055 [Erythrobacter sp.]|jgi:hypothetical protein
MSALPPDDMRNLRQTAFAARHPVDSMIARWHAIHSGMLRLAALAELAEANACIAAPDFIAALEQANDWQRELAWQGVEDIAAMLDAGMSALAVLESRGIAPRIPALTLWQEVDAAQRSLLAMLAMTASAPSAATA